MLDNSCAKFRKIIHQVRIEMECCRTETIWEINIHRLKIIISLKFLPVPSVVLFQQKTKIEWIKKAIIADTKRELLVLQDDSRLERNAIQNEPLTYQLFYLEDLKDGMKLVILEQRRANRALEKGLKDGQSDLCHLIALLQIKLDGSSNVQYTNLG